MDHVSSLPARSEDLLSSEDRQRLAAAHRRLREAVASYEQYLGGELQSGEPSPVQDFHELAKAQARVEAAEQGLWHLREELLGWTRPPWAPGAALVADWFSEEDSVYDDVGSGSAQ